MFLEDHQRTRETKTAHAPLLRFHEKVSRFGNNGDLKIEVIRHFPRTGNVCGLRFTFVPLDQTPEVSESLHGLFTLFRKHHNPTFKKRYDYLPQE